MTRSVYTTLLLGAAVIALSACGSNKGPGTLGSKDDIVVRNNGMPGANTEAPLPPSSGGEAFTSTVENVEANSAAAVDAPESLDAPTAEQQPLPSTDPAIEQAVQQVEESQAPVPTTATAPMNDGTASSTAPATDTVPADIVAPEPVTQEQTAPVQTPAPAPAEAPVSAAPPVGTPIETTTGAPVVPDDAPASAVEALGARTVSPSSVYPAEDYPAEALVQQEGAAAMPVPAAAPAAPVQSAPAPAASAPADGAYSYKPLPAGSTYNADPNAPYSPSAAATAAPAASVDVATPSAPAASGAMDNTATIKAAQAALKLKGFYAGAETGAVDAAFLNALSKYQSDNGLPMGGLNAETLRSLGVAQ